MLGVVAGLQSVFSIVLRSVQEIRPCLLVCGLVGRFGLHNKLASLRFVCWVAIVCRPQKTA